MMSVDTIELDFRAKISDKVQLYPEGVDRFQVFTPFILEDGDHLAIVLKKENSDWIFSDEGHTYMRLTYDIDGASLQNGLHKKLISEILSKFQVKDYRGELKITIEDGNYGDALYSFVQAILQISNISYISNLNLAN